MRHSLLRPAATPDRARDGGGVAGGVVGRKWGRLPWAAAGVLAVVVLGAGAVAVFAGGDSGKRGETAMDGDAGSRGVGKSAAASDAVRAAEARVEKAEAEGAALERTGADGAFIVTVTGVRCGVRALAAGGARQRARGQFCLVGVAVENAGREARVLDGAAQRAVDDHGRAYAVDTRAAGFPAELRGFPVPAGATVRGVLPFDVPVRNHLVALLVHESAGSRGARVTLS